MLSSYNEKTFKYWMDNKQFASEVFQIKKEALMKNKILSFILAFFVILIFSSVTQAVIAIEIEEGKEVILTLNNPSKRVSLADCDIADIKSICGKTATGVERCIKVMKEKCETEKCEKEKCDVAKSGKAMVSIGEVVLNGKKSGITTLIVWDKEGKKTFYDVIVYGRSPTVSTQNSSKALQNLHDEIQKVAPNDNITVEKIGVTIVLKGSVINRQTIQNIENVALLFAPKGCIGIKRDCSLPLGCVLSDEKEKGEEKGGGVTVQVAAQGKEQKISVTQEKAEDSLCVLNLITMPETQQVVLEVKVAAIDKSKLKQLGISYLIKTDDFILTGPGLFSSATGTVGGIGGGGGIGNDINFDIGNIGPQIAFASFPGDIAAVLRALQAKGFGKILAEPYLIVTSGQKGTFHVGRRIPIQTIFGIGASATPSITFEDVGVKLVFAPVVLETGLIRLKIDPAEVSNVVRYINVGGIIAPEIDTRRVTTSVDLKDGESFIVAGLLSEEMKKNIQKIPVLGDIPILGAFFRSTSDELNEKDIAFFITPRLFKSKKPGDKTPLPTDNRPTPEEERQFQWIPMPGSGEGADTKTETK